MLHENLQSQGILFVALPFISLTRPLLTSLFPLLWENPCPLFSKHISHGGPHFAAVAHHLKISMAYHKMRRFLNSYEICCRFHGDSPKQFSVFSNSDGFLLQPLHLLLMVADEESEGQTSVVNCFGPEWHIISIHISSVRTSFMAVPNFKEYNLSSSM